MKKITRKKHLEMRLESIPYHPKPKIELEQYTTPSIIASDLVWNANLLGDILDKNIIDLGSGTGMLSFASLFMGANYVCGVDIDADSVDLAHKLKDKLNFDNVNFVVSDLSDFSCDFQIDTIFQNPPFGSQKMSNKGQDLKFVDKAVELNPNVLYSFHMASTEKFLINYYKNINLEISHIFRYSFPIPKIYDFHTKDSQNVDVIVIRAEL